MRPTQLVAVHDEREDVAPAAPGEREGGSHFVDADAPGYVPVRPGGQPLMEDCDLFFDVLSDLEENAHLAGLHLVAAVLEKAMDACIFERRRLEKRVMTFSTTRKQTLVLAERDRIFPSAGSMPPDAA